MSLTDILNNLLGVYTPIMVGNYTALDVPYIVRAIVFIVIVSGCVKAINTVIRGVWKIV